MATTEQPTSRRPPAPTQLIAKERYTSQEFLNSELDTMWSRVWQIACLESDIPNPGDYCEYTIGLESVLVVRGFDGVVRAFLNVCQHRGRQLRQGAGNTHQLRCPFHGWTWNLDGTLAEAPEREEFCPFANEEVALVDVRVDQWEQFIFINLDPDAEPLLEYLGAIPERLKGHKLSGQYKWFSRSTTLPVNWKTALDAFQEAYHGRFVHAESIHFVDYVDNPIELLDRHSVLSATFGVPDRLINVETDVDTMLDAMEWTFAAFGEDTQLIGALRSMNLPEGTLLREVLIPLIAGGMAELGIDVSELSETELVDDWEYFIFPNVELHVLSFGAWMFRTRPIDDDPESMIFDMWYFHKVPDGMETPPPAEHIHVPNGETCGAVMDQDFRQVEVQQRGFHSAGFKGLRLSTMETRISHMHDVLDRYINS
jgi:phenylpropionate dioxygenase-like ring-hydroxylating dioxygenase large terminal subunit